MSSQRRTLELSEELSLPLDIVTMRVAEYGDSGSGKTAFARLLAEKVYDAKHRFCAIDLKNDWWGLKSSADGATAGIPVVIFGGPKADVKLVVPDRNEGGAEPVGYSVAETVASIDQPVIIDLDALSRTKQERFLAPFLDRLYDVSRQPILLFCDECDRYAPQKPMTPDAILSLSSSEDIARRGRKRGIGSCWLTQRTAVLNKNVSEFANLVAIFRTPGSKDLDELQDRVGRIASKDVVKEVLKLAPGLEDGQAFFLSSHPRLRAFMPGPVRPIQLPLPRTFDSSATPGVGQRRREPKVLAQADLAAIESKMAQQVQRAKENDAAELKKTIVDLRRQLKTAETAKPAPPPPPAKTKTVERLIVRDQQIQRLEQLAKRFDNLVPKVGVAVSAGEVRVAELREIGDAIAAGVKAIDQAVRLAKAPAAAPTPPATVRPLRAAAPPQRLPRDLTPSNGKQVEDEARAPGELSSTEQKILDSLAWWETVGVAAPDRSSVAFVAGYRVGGHFKNVIGGMRTAGLIEYPASECLAFTDSGRALARFPEQPGTLERLHELILNKLDSTQRKLVSAVIEAHPQPLEVEQLAERSGYNVGGHFKNVLGSVRSLGLVSKRGPIAATGLLFPSALTAELPVHVGT